MSIVSRADVDAAERESALVAFVAERALRYGPRPNASKTTARFVLEMGVNDDMKRIIEKGEALADRVRGTDIEKAIRKGDVAAATAMLARIDEAPTSTPVPERTAQKENETRKNGTANRVGETISTSLKAGTITFGGALVMVVFTVYNLLPLAGAVAVVVGLVGFFTGAPHALRAFIAGLVMLAVKPIAGAIFSKALEPDGKKRPKFPAG